jgi:hypothetical protein
LDFKETSRRFPISRWLAIALVLLAASISAASAAPRIYPTGTTIYDPARAYNSFVVFSAPDGKTHLIDLDGNEVHTWDHVGLPGNIIDPKLIGGKRGHAILQIDNADEGAGIYGNRKVGEVDWDGNVQWEWGTQAPGGMARQNHDWQRLPNGNTLLLVTVPHAVNGLGPKVIGDQGIYEVDPSGKIVWKWIAGDHLTEFGFSNVGLAYLKERIRRNPPEIWGYLEINNLQVVGSNKWFDAGDKRFDPENLLIDSRKGNVVLVIEKKSGKVVWRLGPDFPGSEYAPDQRILRKDLPRPVDQLSGQHHAQIIPKGLPGAGNLLLFDDQGGAGFPPASLGIYAGSRILEIDPIKKEIVWQYTGENSGRSVWSFHSSLVSSVQRLPNGNTLIDEGVHGRFFQITPGGDIVWEYVNPYLGRWKTADGKPFQFSLVYRIQAVPYDWVPEGTPHAETPVTEIDITKFRVPR